MTKKTALLNNTALFIALLFHVSGLIGILYTQQKDWFIQHTALNLSLMAGLLIITQQQKNLQFFLFFIITFIAGFGVELIGANTAALFGNYNYGEALGPKLLVFRSSLASTGSLLFTAPGLRHNFMRTASCEVSGKRHYHHGEDAVGIVYYRCRAACCFL